MRVLVPGLFNGVVFAAGLAIGCGAVAMRAQPTPTEQSCGSALSHVHRDTRAARESVQQVIDRYRKGFDQQSVLWESARVYATS
jgi:hypothetical protein